LIWINCDNSPYSATEVIHSRNGIHIMFVKKDLRKIPEIFADAADSSEADSSKSISELRLARRPAEFKGSIAPLCQPQYRPSLQTLTSLSLYDCQISNLQNIEFLSEACPVLQEINLGRNPLASIPDELGQMKSLTSLSLDDCEVEGPIPACLYQLQKLQSLRMSNNRITRILTSENDNVGDLWPNMEMLCLDGNMIEDVPEQLDGLAKLKILMLR
jgi:Leucine-rich repeat (LRR) protein